jgi:hypothetical protein
VASVSFVYYGAGRGVDEHQALFLADALRGRGLFSATAAKLAQRIREEAGADFQRLSEEIDLEEADARELLHVLDQADLDKELESELRSLQMMLRGERWPGEPEPPASTA